jgi:hypothetical protein
MPVRWTDPFSIRATVAAKSVHLVQNECKFFAKYLAEESFRPRGSD